MTIGRLPMKIFTSGDDAIYSMNEKDKVYVNSMCPYSNNVCGSWCALFYIDNSPGQTPYIIMGCSNSQIRLYVNT